ncbi:chromosome partitioning protein ParA [Paenibacillus sinopodophylli]|uniref:chromosome partitioning protein ParA n=1 Tax=Paenibacillus sinopodophylli TaxID=1837342 RepID=UPI00110CE8C5|nr:chromosome partitioning protein ParA [Paenibacillus sinopodophylli]
MYRLQAAKTSIKTQRDKLAAKIGQRDLITIDRDQAQLRSLEAVNKLGQYDLVQILLQKTSDYARQQAKGRIEDIVTQLLLVVFPGNDFVFEIVLDVKGSQPVAEYWLTRNGVKTQLKPPDYDNGGGYVDVITLGLRLGIAELEEIQGPLLMDEVGKHVSAEYSPNVAYFLKQYSEQLGRQIILITHNEALAAVADKGLRVTLNSREESEVKAI